MGRYLQNQSGTFNFRRKVPSEFRKRIGVTEIRRSLGTGSRKLAKIRAAQLYLVSERLFEYAKMIPSDKVGLFLYIWYSMIITFFCMNLRINSTSSTISISAVKSFDKLVPVAYPLQLSSKVVGNQSRHYFRMSTKRLLVKKINLRHIGTYPHK
ncbi:DUF6538 domain-containing protein [Sneathiella sp.]|uniref:DUF6538 domain-containing protein n=1 Tax=Sneathiella sp. TaxID=1964365 RepID=UPI0035673D59